MKISFKILTYDFWVGMFHDRKKDIIYFNPLPCCVFKIEHDNYHQLSYGKVKVIRDEYRDEALVFKLDDISVVPKLLKKLDLFYCYMSDKVYTDLYESNRKLIDDNDVFACDMADNILIFVSGWIYNDIMEKGVRELI